MLLGFFDEDPAKAEEAYEKLQAAEKSEARRIENEANFLSWSFRSGNASAQTALQALEEKAVGFPDTKAEICRWDAFCSKFAGDTTRAIKRFKDAAAIARTPELRARNLRSAAATLAECEQRAEAEDLLVTSLAETTDAEAKAELYYGLADLYQRDSPAKRAFMLEKVLLYRPMDKGTHFDAAYAYSDAGLNGLSVIHYEKCLSISMKQEMATNNLGVAFAALKLPAHAVKKYKKSIELGGTLAAANLGQLLIEAGALDEAGAILTEARRKESVHQNVFFASNKLENNKTAEEERKNMVSEVAAKYQRFLLSYTDAMLDRTAWNFPTGKWKSATAKSVSVTVSAGQQLQAKWSVSRGHAILMTEDKYRFKGRLVGKVAAGTLEIMKCDPFLTKKDAENFGKYGDADAFFSGTTLSVAGVNPTADEFQLAEFTCTAQAAAATTG